MDFRPMKFHFGWSYPVQSDKYCTVSDSLVAHHRLLLKCISVNAFFFYQLLSESKLVSGVFHSKPQILATDLTL